MISSLTSHRFGRHSILTAAWLALMLNSAAVMASLPPAGLPETGLPEFARAVPDEELEELRGKFVTSDAVSFFGISMLTSWQDQAGITTTAQIALNVDFLKLDDRGKPTSQMLIGWNRAGDPADPDMDVTDTNVGYVPYIVAADVTSVGGLDSTTGVAQANVITGADNRSHNTLQVAIVPGSMIKSIIADKGLKPAQGGSSVSLADGDSIEFRLAQNQVGLVLTGANGIDSSMQAIGATMGQVLQQTVLNSNRNEVMNSLRILVASDHLSAGADTIKLSQALSSMKGNSF